MTTRGDIPSMPIPASLAEEGINTVCEHWNDSVAQITDDLLALYCRIPEGMPLGTEICHIVSRLQVANKTAANQLRQFRVPHDFH